MSCKNRILLSELLLFVYTLAFSYGVHGNILSVGSGAMYENIQNAVDQAQNGDTIALYDGVYSGSMNTNINLGAKSLIITGNSRENSVINCQSQGFAFNSRGTSVSLMIYNMTITNCVNNGGNGGALMMVLNSSNIAISDVSFLNNSALYGGAIYFEGYLSSADVSNSLFQYNNATSGGALYAQEANVTIRNTLFDSNRANTGGAIDSSTSSVHVVDSRFNMNRANVRGGAWMSSSCRDVLITNSQFTKNRAVNDGPALMAQSSTCHINGCYFAQNYGETGGAVSAAQSAVFVDDCTIVNNTGSSWGGALYGESNTLLDVSETQMSFNFAGLGGGAIAVFSEAEIFLAECTITSNVAPSGGAVFLQYDNEVSIAESIITDNRALSNGGGIYCSDSTITMDKLSALSNNTSPEPEDANIYCAKDISYTICQIDGDSEYSDFCDMVPGNGGATTPVLSKTGLAIVIVVLAIGGLSVIGVIAIGCWVKKKNKEKTHYKFLEMQDEDANILLDD